jgi:hypothetical protein
MKLLVREYEHMWDDNNDDFNEYLAQQQVGIRRDGR